MSNSINITKITTALSDTPNTIYTVCNWLLSFKLGVAVGVALWVTSRTGNTINEISIAIDNK